MQFHNPYAFLALLAIPAAIYLSRIKAKNAGIIFSSAKKAQGAGASKRQQLLFIPLLLRVLALVALVLAIARPQQGREYVREISKGVAIELIVDRSGSMAAEMNLTSGRANRLEVVKKVIDDFIHGTERELDGRSNDLVGMIAFARYADTVCPLTLSHGALSEILENIDIVRRREEDGTSIGDALALAAARLSTYGDTVAADAQDDSYEIKSKVIVLLTDGQNNFGKRTPLQAAKLAKEWGIKVYTIGIGGDDGFSTISTAFGEYKVPISQAIDEQTLIAIAEETGGFYRRAGDEDSLREVYSEIDDMEKSEIESIRYLDYKELFLPFAFAALIFIVIEAGLRSTVFRRIP